MARDLHTKATFARVRLIGQLRWSNELAVALADILAACTDSYPGQSAACLGCGLTFQQTAVEIVNEFIDAPSRAMR